MFMCCISLDFIIYVDTQTPPALCELCRWKKRKKGAERINFVLHLIFITAWLATHSHIRDVLNAKRTIFPSLLPNVQWENGFCNNLYKFKNQTLKSLTLVALPLFPFLYVSLSNFFSIFLFRFNVRSISVSTQFMCTGNSILNRTQHSAVRRPKIPEWHRMDFICQSIVKFRLPIEFIRFNKNHWNIVELTHTQLVSKINKFFNYSSNWFAISRKMHNKCVRIEWKRRRGRDITHKIYSDANTSMIKLVINLLFLRFLLVVHFASFVFVILAINHENVPRKSDHIKF